MLFDIISSMECIGGNNWDKVGVGDDTNLLEEVRNSRYLTINLSNGFQINSLKYTALSGQFYEYGGIAYNQLNETDCQKIEKLLGI